MNFYNDIDPKACAWMQELIDSGEIAPGVVDSRSIKEIQPHELDEFDQCHFFCGIAGWPLALRWAGLDTTPGIWTGSCPCQPFSCAGKGLGTEDDRHLWPEFFRLIRACRPTLVLGEQVASADVIGKVGRKAKGESAVVWLDGICGDLEGAGYATGSAVLGAFSAGAPHRRRRLYWMADSENPNWRTGKCGAQTGTWTDGERRRGLGIGSEPRSLADAERIGERWRDERGLGAGGQQVGEPENGARAANEPCDGGKDASPLGNPSCGGCGDLRDAAQPGRCGHADRAGGAGGDRMADPEGERSSRAGTDMHIKRAFAGCAGGDAGGVEKPVQSGARNNEQEPRYEGRGAVDSRAEGIRQADRKACTSGTGAGGSSTMPGWDRFDILPCRDEKARRVEHGVFPLVQTGRTQSGAQPVADGLPGGLVPGGDPSVEEAQATPEARTMRLKGYGNAICPQLATEFIIAVMDITKGYNQ